METRALFMAISPFFAARCFVLFSYITLSKAGHCVQSQLTHLSCIKEPRTHSSQKHQNLKDQMSLSSLPLVMCFCWENQCFESFPFWANWRALWKLDDYALPGKTLKIFRIRGKIFLKIIWSVRTP